MRQLEKIEKQIIEDFYTEKNNGSFIFNYLWDKLDNEDIVIDRMNKTVEIVFWSKDPNGPTGAERRKLLRMIEYIEQEIVIIVNLINYLENQGYIICYKKVENAENIETISKAIPEGIKMTKKFPDIKINELLIEFMYKKIITTPILDDLKEHGFVAIEDRKYKTNLKISIIGICVAIFIGFVTIFIQLFNNQEINLSRKTINELEVIIKNQSINKEAIHLHNIGEIIEIDN